MSNAAHRFLILHGLNGSPEGHWQHWLAGQLLQRGHEVCFPELPNPGEPHLDRWNSVLHRELCQELDTTLFAHSLGAYLWLRYASGGSAFRVRRALLVSPPGRQEVAANSRINAASHIGFNAAHIRSAADEILLVGSASDPFCSAGFAKEYAIPLGINYLETPSHTGHLNIESGFGSWDFALEWALRSRELQDRFINDNRTRTGASIPNARI
ncbi:MAG: hypothetical protein RLZZ505_573 [Verrucomicrobiota bacterium]